MFRSLLIIALVGLLACGPAWGREIRVEPVALTGTSGPLGPGLEQDRFSRFFDSSFGQSVGNSFDINGSGTVVLSARSGRAGGGIWTAQRGASPLVRLTEQDTSPVTLFNNEANLSLDRFAFPLINDTGKIVFGALIGFPGGGIWTVDSSATERTAIPIAIARVSGQYGPQVNGQEQFGLLAFHLGDIFSYALNSSGQVAFTTRTDATRDGIWRQLDSANLEVLALTRSSGELGPGLEENDTFFQFDPPVKQNDAGEIFFQARTSDDSRNGLWTIGANGIDRSLVFGNDNELDDFSPFGFDFDRAFVAAHDKDGNAALFMFGLIGEQSSTIRGLGLAPKNGTPTQIARSGTDGVGGPGLGAGFEFNDRFSQIVVSGSNLAFRATLNDGRSGIWITDATGALTPVVIEAGLTSVGEVPEIDTFDTVSLMQMTDQGELVFSNDGTLWLYDDGELQSLFTPGDEIDFDPTSVADLRQIDSAFSFSLDDSGWLAARVLLTDGEEALLRLNIRGVPEPSSLVVALLSCVTLLTASRKR